MSKDALAAFLKKVALDKQLQDELVAIAGKHGFPITSDELSDLDLTEVSGGSNHVNSKPGSRPTLPEDDPDDPPGFGIIEVPA